MTKPYGLIFCGVPGQFSVWIAAPSGNLLDRDAVENLGQMATRSGASDYRPFPLEGADLDRALSANPGPLNEPVFVGEEEIRELARIVVAHEGLPPRT